ncbi:disease resistance protein RPS2-like [Magnolia sinica]|nr:disease resistance protein RPS2-like [Magnolia sinica]
METPQCPNLLTLMLQWNHCEKIHTDFFQLMPLLRVLDLSGTSIILSELPAGIGNLAELRYLNLSATGITSLPEEIGNLVKMRQLELESTLCLERIPHGLISRLPELRVINLFGSLYFNWEEGSSGFNITELEGLERLIHLGITISTVHSLERLLGSSKMRNMIQYLQLTGCKGRTISTQLSSRLTVMRNLKRLFIEDSRTLEEATIGADGESDYDYPASSLEWLRFDCLSVLNCIRVGRICFRSLNRIHISNCSKLKKIVGLLHLESLETIEIRSCDVLEEVISKAADEEEVGDKGLMQLKAIKLEDLPKLKNICSYAMDFPSLEAVEVINCPKLKKLPLSLHSTQNSLPETRGEKEWWDGLEWEENDIKSSLLPSFKDIKKDRMANRELSYMLR